MEASDDAIADLRPLRNFRAKMIAKKPKVAAAAVRAAVDLWDKLASAIFLRGEFGYYQDPSTSEFVFGELDVVVPKAFGELTQLIVWWCDKGELSIDPAPLMECSSHATWTESYVRRAKAFRLERDVERFKRDVERFKREFEEFKQDRERCQMIIARIRYAISVTIGEEPEVPPTGTRGRPLGSGNTAEIIEELKTGLDPADVAKLFNCSKRYAQDLRRQIRAESEPNLVKNAE